MLLTSMHCPKGDVDGNLERSCELLSAGAEAGCDLVVLPEMSLTGYECSAAIALNHPAVQELVRSTVDAPALCFGLVESAAPEGGSPFITQVLADGCVPVAVHRKATLGEGEDTVFQVGTAADRIVVRGTALSIAVCAEIGSSPPYRLGSSVVLAPSAPGLYGKRRSTDEDWQRGFDWWRGSVVDDARRLLNPGQWLAVSGQAGATYDEDFPGWAALIGSGGKVVAELPDWREGTLVVDVPE